MNHHILPPLLVALLSGVLFPRVVARARWTREAPRTAVAGWLLLSAAFVLAVATGVLQLLLPYASSHALADRAAACLPWTPEGCRLPGAASLAGLSGAEYAAVGAAAVALLLPAAALCHHLVRARRSRAQHSSVLRLVGRTDPALRAVVIDHDTPAVYCLPGRAARIVVSSGARKTLTPPQLAAALEHERAHIAGRHHLLISAAETFGGIFRRLPLGRMVRTEVPLLLEMAADDRALRRCSRDALATALYAMATGQQTPPMAFAAGGPSAALRMRRILTPHRHGHPALRGILAGALAAAAVTPLVLACCSQPG
ncbi:M56 family metallopeptidase [Streptomyces sp. NPDC042319]|uniref:M56 family metallopeptidase n=1 Tax=Streptomyces sp. NPDC042319 TaxID=3154332 RepID=UPI0033C27021